MAAPDAVQQAKDWLADQGVPPPSDLSPSNRLPSNRLPSNRSPSNPSPTDSPAVAHGAEASRVTCDDSANRDGSGGRGGPEREADADPESVARAIVVRKLGLRAHTRAELERSLQAKLVPAEAAAAVLDRMAELGLIDDETFARDWVESRQQRRHLSRRALRQELTRKGVDRQTIESAVQQVDSDDEVAAARALVDKKRSALDRVEPHVRYRRLAGLLGRRGYSSAVVSLVLNETIGDRGD